MRLCLLGVILVACVALWWFLDDLLAMRAWVVMHPGADPEITRGWPVVLAAWPVALAGGLLSGIGAFATLGGLMARAEDHDHRRHRERLQWELSHAETQAAHAEQDARTALQAEREQVQQLRTQAQEAIRQAARLHQQAISDQAAAREQVAQAHAERDQANRRAQHASAAFARKARQGKTRPIPPREESGSPSGPR